MRKLKLYIAASINGKIAKKDGSVQWLDELPNPANDDYGYAKFYDSIDTTVMGAATHRQVVGWGIDYPYVGKKNYVLTRDKNQPSHPHVEYITSNHDQFVKSLKMKTGKDIWLVGGGQVNSLLLTRELIDEIHVYYMPIVLETGIDLFDCNIKNQELELLSSESYRSGVIGAVYAVKKSSFKTGI